MRALTAEGSLLAALARQAILDLAARHHPTVRVEVRIGRGTWATWYRGPCRHHPTSHRFTFGTALLERLTEAWDHHRPGETSAREMVRYGWDRLYGPVTPLLRLVCLVLHEFAHLAVDRSGLRERRHHGPAFRQALLTLHGAGEVDRLRARLAPATQAAPWLAEPLLRLTGPPRLAVPPGRFRPGQRVVLTDRGGPPRPGRVLRIGRRTVSVRLDGDPPDRWWRVPPELLLPGQNSSSHPLGLEGGNQ